MQRLGKRPKRETPIAHVLGVTPAVSRSSLTIEGSTLLLKGLEADVSVILNAAGLKRRNLYVAMTRGARRVVICSPPARLQPG
jgi:hypothetical protein